MEGDCVTLHTGVKTHRQVRLRWYYNDIRLGQVNGDVSKTCTDVHCKRRFRGRLELDDRTGSLTITRIMTADDGVYKLKVLGSHSSETIFNVTVNDQKKPESVKESESVTFYTGVANPDALMTWCFNDICIAEINGHADKTCTDVQCKDGDERFRGRLKLDHQTGSLSITDTRTTDSGVYTLQISSRSSIIRNFSIAVLYTRTPDLIVHNINPAFVGGFLLALALALALPMAVICCYVCFCDYKPAKPQKISSAVSGEKSYLEDISKISM
ncbi:uncharacterized protein LOC122327455 isoform X2 [Puntigrus tetrazona]|nr:uncharacterized protein LOC122327455 isoform X2 [Puntigrus tetrazona]